MTWSQLGLAARLFRIAHAVWGAFNLTALAWLWIAAAQRRRGRSVDAAAALLFSEGAALVVGRGNCPFGPFQARLGDPVPMFEWFLPPRAAKAAVPVLAGMSLAALAAVALRPPAGRGVSWRLGRQRAIRDARLRLHAQSRRGRGRPVLH